MRPSRGFVLSLFLLVASSSAVYAEGSAEFDAADVNGVHDPHDQELSQDTVLFLDILDGNTEEICWRGNGSVVVRRPRPSAMMLGMSLGTVTNGSCVNAVDAVNGAYEIDMQSDQNAGTEWSIRVCTKGQNNATCFAGLTPNNGRLWSYTWNFEENTNYDDDYSINGSVYALVPGGGTGLDAVIEMQMRGVSGARYRLAANTIGPELSTTPFTRIGRSVPRTGHRFTPSLPLYINPPAKAQYNWVSPEVTDVTIAPSCGGAVVQGVAPGTIRFGSNVVGQYVVICDVDKNTVYDFASQTDFSSFGAAAVGMNMITWDGRNNAGASAAEDTYQCIVRLNVGEFHYVAEDMETSYPGIRMFRINRDKTTRSGIPMFWDDTDVPLGDMMLNGQLAPRSPLPNGLLPGAYADAATPFFYMGGNTSLPMGNARAWGDYDLGNNDDANGRGNETFLDQFAAAETDESTPIAVRVISSGTDSDSDGLTNTRECQLGADPTNADTDGDGVDDGEEASMSDAPNTDDDGPIDILDPDSDNDGVDDGDDEDRYDPNVCRDMDGDACDDCVLTGADQSGGDTGGDGTDTNDDGECNVGDPDDDGDGVADGTDSAPLDPDGDNDGVNDGDDTAPTDPMRCRDTDQDTCDDCSRTGANQSGGDPANDGDDADGDGRCGTAGMPGSDADGDGVADADDLDRDNDGIPNAEEEDGDEDGDGVDNEYDLDSDGDGVSDIVEAGGGSLDENGDGRIDDLVDVSAKNGLHDPLQSEDDALPLPDTDEDGRPDFLDTDDDGDGLTTESERPDGEDVDTDGDETPDYLDADDDDDGVPTRDELDDDGNPRDTDGDGVWDHLDADDDGDGVSTRDERTSDGRDRDTDRDGIPNHLDRDDDGDGVSTRDERTRDGRDQDTDDDDTPDHLDTDDDGDGIDTNDEPRDADRNGTPDRLERQKGTLAGGALCSVQDLGARAVSQHHSVLWLCLGIGWLIHRRRRTRAYQPRKWRTVWLVLLIGIGVALFAPQPRALAQVALDQFRPAPLATDGFAVGRPTVLPHEKFGAVLMLDYADDPLVYERTPRDPDSEERIVETDLVLHATVALGLWDRLAVFLGVPVHLVMDGDSTLTVPAAIADGAGLGDIALGARIRIAGDDTTLAALAGELIARLPTADWADSEQTYRGDSIGSYEPALLLELHAGAFDIRARAGVRLRKEVSVSNLELGQELAWGLGARLRVAKPVWLHVEVHGSTYLAHAFEREHTPAEALGGAKVDLHGWNIGAAAGPGLLRGYGSPDLRVVGMVGYAEPTESAPVDTDRDGLFDPQDRCPREPEDRDGYRDDDGCPDPDNDGDGILDVSDKCRNQPEDKDDFEDEDGCPEPDNDLDGILDVDDHCPMEPEDADGFQDDDGCADPDNDKDHILDSNDACALEPEDFDGWEDTDGCPEEAAGMVKLTCEKIEITDSVYFETGSDHIQERSFTLLNQVAGVLQQATQIKRLRVEGHTDDRGKDASNLTLSQRRAASVLNYLVDRGVAAERLTSEGYGESRPIADNKTAAGRSQNRRVEFMVVEGEPCR